MAEPTALRIPIGVPIRLLARSDARLARHAAQGDPKAFAAIYERYHQELYRYCRALLGDPHEAQDALQSTMASALRSLPGEERAIELRPWLYRVARNEAVSIIRRRQAPFDSGEVTLPHEPGADVAFESRERLRDLTADLARLPERQRSALVMRELSGLTPGQIGVALGVSAGAARQLIYEARRGLEQLAEGRAMDCDQVRHAISDGDGRVLRGRRLRSHLHGCERCSSFKAGIEARGRDLELIAPPLSAVAASGVLASVLGGSAATGGLLGGAFSGLGVGLGGKTLSLIAASAAIGVGAGAVGDVDLPGTGSGPDPSAARAQSEAAGAPREAGASAQGAADESRGVAGSSGGKDARAAGEGRRNSAEGAGARKDAGQGAEHAADGSAAASAAAAAPAGSGPPATPPGSDVAAGRSGGHSAAPTTGPRERAVVGPPPKSNVGGPGKGKKPVSSP